MKDPLSLEARVRREPAMVARRIGDEIVLVPVARQTVDLDSVFVLSEVAARTWELLDGERTLAQVRDALAAEFDAPTDRILADLRTLLADLRRLGAVREPAP